MKCSVKHCNENARDQLAVIDDGRKRMVLCPIHQIQYATSGLFEHSMTIYNSLEAEYLCEICGKAAYLYADEVEIRLCETHLKKLLRRSLNPAEYAVLHKQYGVFNLICDDLYIKGGYAVQPIY